MDRFVALSAFVAVVEAEGFTAAARKLGVSPSAVTRLVGSLEDQLAVRLLQRTTRSVKLTDAGARYFERARTILHDLEEADRAAQDEQGHPIGRLSVAAPVMFGRLHVAPLTAAYAETYEDVSIELELNDRFVNLIDEGVDVAFRIGHLVDSSLVARRLGVTRRVAIAAPTYLAQAGVPAHPQDLAEHRTIAARPLAPRESWTFYTSGNANTVQVRPAYVTNSVDAALAHTIRGGGITLALAYQVRDFVRAGALAVILETHEPPPIPIHAVYPSSRLLSTKVRALLAMVRPRAWDFLDFA